MNHILFLISLILSTYISCKSILEGNCGSNYQIITDRFARCSRTNTCKLGFYYGGDYQGIIKKLDYIKGLGFDAIWISPIIEITERSYHGYHFTNLYKLNSYFGSESDFKDLVKACHKKDIWIKLDVVINHVGSFGNDYSKINPFNSDDIILINVI